MSALTVGQPAPRFRLPSGQGPEVGLEDYRGRPVIVWFTKGMGCAFCRQHMSQLSRIYAEIRARSGEVLEITPTPLLRARFYVSNFKVPFPYLSDPDYRVHAAYGIDVRPKSLARLAGAFYAGARTPDPPSDYGVVKPRLSELPEILRDTDMGFFVVDGDGIMRFAKSGSYTTDPPPGAPGLFAVRPIPGADEILAALERGRAT